MLIALKIFFVIVAIDPLAANPFAAPKAMLSRALLYITIPMAVAAALAERLRVRVCPIWYLAAAAVAVASLATLTAVDQITALYGAPRRLLGLTSIVDGAVTAGLIAAFTRSRRGVAILALAFTAAVVVNLGYGTVQFLGLDPVKWIDPALNGTIGNSTSFAAFMAVAFAVAWTVLVTAWPRMRCSARAALAVLALATSAMVGLSGARAPALALPASALAGVAIAFRVRPFDRVTLWRWGPFVAAGAVAAGAALLLSPAGTRLIAIARGGDTSLDERQLIYGMSFEAVARRPLLGVGPDGLISVYQALRPPEAAQMADVIAAGQTSAHGWLLSHAVGMGVVGAAAFLGLLVVALWRAWTGARGSGGILHAAAFAALIAFTAQGLFTVSSIPLELVFWGLVGLVAAGTGSVSAVTTTRAPSAPIRWGAAGVAVLVGVALASATLGAAGAQRALLLSNSARQHGDLASAARWADEATRLDPRRADHWNTLGLAFTRRDPPAAIRAFQRAVDLAPYDSVYLLNLAAEEAVHAQRDPSYRDRALRHVHEAVGRDPNWPLTMKRASEILAVFGLGDEAVQLADRAILLQPRSASYYDWASKLHGGSGDVSRAITLLEQAIRIDWPRGDLPADIRLRLAQLYRTAGREDEARRLVPGPQLVGAVVCSGPCVTVSFRSTTDMRTGVGAGSVTDPATYMLDGRPLPAGTKISARDGGRTVTIDLPAPHAAVEAGTVLAIREAHDALSNSLTIPRVVLVRQADLIPYDAWLILDEAEGQAAAAAGDPVVRQRLVERVQTAVALYPQLAHSLRKAADIMLTLGATSDGLRLVDMVVDFAPVSPDHLEWASRAHAAKGDPQRAIALLERYARVTSPSGDLPKTLRIRLGELYRTVGRSDRASELVPVPRLVSGQVCHAQCFVLGFDSVADMVTGDAPGSVTRADTYLFGGQPLPAATRFSAWDGGRAVSVDLPSGSAIVVAGSTVVLRGARDSFGNVIQDASVTLTNR